MYLRNRTLYKCEKVGKKRKMFDSWLHVQMVCSVDNINKYGYTVQKFETNLVLAAYTIYTLCTTQGKIWNFVEIRLKFGKHQTKFQIKKNDIQRNVNEMLFFWFMCQAIKTISFCYN